MYNTQSKKHTTKDNLLTSSSVRLSYRRCRLCRPVKDVRDLVNSHFRSFLSFLRTSIDRIYVNVSVAIQQVCARSVSPGIKFRLILFDKRKKRRNLSKICSALMTISQNLKQSVISCCCRSCTFTLESDLFHPSLLRSLHHHHYHHHVCNCATLGGALVSCRRAASTRRRVLEGNDERRSLRCLLAGSIDHSAAALATNDCGTVTSGYSADATNFHSSRNGGSLVGGVWQF
jgi:hypothetical protein